MRIAAARALRGTKLGEGRVYDSAIAPIDQTIAEERKPIFRNAPHYTKIARRQ
jgi:hypothetical protein